MRPPAAPRPARRGVREAAAPAGPLLVLARDGARRDLAAKTGKGLILHFWATWCAPCREEMPELVKFVGDTKDDPRVEFLAVSADEDWKIVDAWLKERRNLGPAGRAGSRRARSRSRYGATGYPETFFIAPSGEIVQHFVGPPDWSSPEVPRVRGGVQPRVGRADGH